MKTFALLLALAVSFAARAQQAIDGGEYSESKVHSDIVKWGGRVGDAIPSEQFPSSDRQSRAPDSKTFFVLSPGNHCYYATYKTIPDTTKKVLIIFRKSQVKAERCIYQSVPSPQPEGFAVLETDGGECKPVFSESLEQLRGDPDRNLRVLENTVSMNHCFDGTFSYGLALERKKIPLPVAQTVPVELPKKKVISKVIPALEQLPDVDPDTTTNTTTEAKPVKLEKKKISHKKTQNENMRTVANVNSAFTIQVAAFPKEAEAESHKAELQVLGFKAEVQKVSVNGINWYRLLVGKFTTKEKALRYKKQKLPKYADEQGFVRKL